MEDVVEKIIDYGKRFGDIEVSINKSINTSVKFEGNELKEVSEGESMLIAVRITSENKFGFSTASNINAWKECVKNASKLARVSKKTVIPVKLPGKNKYKVISSSKKVTELSTEKIAEICNEMMTSSLDYDNRINISLAEIKKSINQIYFGNSNGAVGKQESALLDGGIEVNIGDVFGFEGHASRHEITDFKKIGIEAAKHCISMLNPRPIKTMKADVILDYFAASNLFSGVLIPAFCADNVQENRSYFKGRVGEIVADENFAVTDDGTLRTGIYSSSFDAEGVPTQRTSLIENGKLIGFLYDTYTAQKEGKKSTGNCKSLSARPFVGESNFIIEKGSLSREQMIESTKRGVIIQFLSGMTHANEVTGDFSVNIHNAHYVENGKIVHPIKHGMISGNIFKLLKQIKGIGDKPRQEESVVSPLIKFGNVQVVGD